jgi:hypothetical protein
MFVAAILFTAIAPSVIASRSSVEVRPQRKPPVRSHGDPLPNKATVPTQKRSLIRRRRRRKTL